VVRTDLPIGNQVSQLVHAAGESSPGNLPNDTHAVVLAARDEVELLKISERLYKRGIEHRLIREPDLENQATAIGVPPQPREGVRRALSCFPLLR